MILLASCASTRSNKIVIAPLPPVIERPDSSLTKLCNRPVALGDKALTQAQIEDLWSKDRVSLINCYKRHKAFADFIAERDRLLAEAMKNGL